MRYSLFHEYMWKLADLRAWSREDFFTLTKYFKCLLHLSDNSNGEV